MIEVKVPEKLVTITMTEDEAKELEAELHTLHFDDTYPKIWEFYLALPEGERKR